MSSVQVKQGLVEQGTYREQENSHLEWPDHTHAFTHIPAYSLEGLSSSSSLLPPYSDFPNKSSGHLGHLFPLNTHCISQGSVRKTENTFSISSRKGFNTGTLVLKSWLHLILAVSLWAGNLAFLKLSYHF